MKNDLMDTLYSECRVDSQASQQLGNLFYATNTNYMKSVYNPALQSYSSHLQSPYTLCNQPYHIRYPVSNSSLISSAAPKTSHHSKCLQLLNAHQYLYSPSTAWPIFLPMPATATVINDNAYWPLRWSQPLNVSIPQLT